MVEDDKMKISAKEARGKLSSLLKRVEEGDEIVVVRRESRWPVLSHFAGRKDVYLAYQNFGPPLK